MLLTFEDNPSIASAQKLKLQLWARHYNCQLSLYSTLLLASCEVLRLPDEDTCKRASGSFNEQKIPKPEASAGARHRSGHQSRRIPNFYQELICQGPNQSELQVRVFLTRPLGGCSNTLLKNCVVTLTLLEVLIRMLGP